MKMAVFVKFSLHGRLLKFGNTVFYACNTGAWF